MKTGLFGGTFDPVHLGHIQLMEAAMTEAGLDRILVIPAAEPPHKGSAGITGFAHRISMLRLALAGHERVELCLIESELPRPSFTIDTVKALERRDPAAARQSFSFIIGSDAFLDITSWKSHGELLAKVSLIVAQRTGAAIVARECVELRERLGYDLCGGRWVHEDPRFQDISFLDVPIARYSSSDIRLALADSRRVVPGLHPEVLAYIRTHQLYRSA